MRTVTTICLIAIITISFLGSANVFAQTDPSEDDKNLVLEEVVVHATRREVSAQSVAITVDSISGDDLRSMVLWDTADVATQSPNVEINAGIGLNSFIIRGIGSNDFQTNFDSPVSVNVDEIYLSKTFMNKALMFDIESVEIIKGPQGTLNGRNTTGGTVNFYTRVPTDELESAVNVDIGNYQTLRAEGFLSGPLGDNVNGRLAFIRVNQGEGFYENITIGGTEGKQDYYAIRGSLDWKFDKTQVSTKLHYGQEGGSVPPYDVTGVYTPESFLSGNPNGGVGGAIGAAASGALVRCSDYVNGVVTGANAGCVRGHDGLISGDADPFTSHGHDYHNVDHESYGGLLRIDHDFNQNIFTSLTAYEYYERDQEEVGDNSPIYTGTWIFWYSEIEQFTQEFRLTSDNDGPLTYVFGLFYEHDELYTRDYLTLGYGDAPGLGGFDTEFDQTVDAAAAFAHGEYSVSESMTFTLGLRYSWEKTKIDGKTCFATGIDRSSKIEIPTSGCLAVLSSSDAVESGPSRTDDNVSFKLGLQWSPINTFGSFDDFMLYGTISTGFRSGGFNADLATIQDAFVSLDPEEIVAYEIGFKSMLASNRVRLNGAVFYYDFKNGFINVDNPFSPVPFTINAAGIDVLGMDLTLQWLPSDTLRIDAGLGILDSEINSDEFSDGLPLDGNSPVNSPEVSYNFSANYKKPLSESLDIAMNVNYSWRSEQFLETNNKPSDRQGSYGLLNAYLGINSTNWSLGLWGRNLTDEAYKTYVNDLPVFGWTLANYGPPRTYGVSASYRFK